MALVKPWLISFPDLTIAITTELSRKDLMRVLENAIDGRVLVGGVIWVFHGAVDVRVGGGNV